MIAASDDRILKESGVRMGMNHDREASSRQDMADSPLQPAENALEYAWRYFALHAQQRMSVFNFFVILSGILATGIGAGLQAGKPMAPVVTVLGALLALLSFVFYQLDRRGAELVKLAEAALISGENICMPEFARIVAEESKHHSAAASLPRIWTFGRAFRLIFWVMGMVGAVASTYSLCSWAAT